MSNIRKKTIAGLKRGDTFTASCTFTEHDATAFADIGRDYSPVHFDLPFAKAKNFQAHFVRDSWLPAYSLRSADKLGGWQRK